jgi:aldehyde oxidoreductase
MKRIGLTINGRKGEFIVDNDRVLLDLLRETLGLIGVKQGCDRKGQCGACTVIVNGKAVLSCLTKVASLDGAKVITVEGLGTPDNPHLVQEAFALTGAIQCGFCTPGMVMATKALLEENVNPTVEDIKHALRRNLCRCTGYKKIIEAVQLAARFVRGEATPDMVRPKSTDGFIGVSHPRPSALAKACGTAAFAGDFRLEGALELAVFRSPVSHARIISIDTSAAEKMAGVAGVLKASGVKGTNILKFSVPDRPVICGDKVYCVGDPVVVVAAETKAQAEAALKTVRVDFESLPVMESPEASLADGAVQIHPNLPNLCLDQPVIRGDAEQALMDSAAVVEARFTTQRVYMAPLEPEATVAYWEDEDKGEDALLTIVGRSINIHQHLGMLQEALGWENMKYVEAYAGGQFGIKLDIMSEGVAGAAAIHFRRPIRYIPSLAESMLMNSKRHPFDMKVKLGADSEGNLTAYFNDILMDKGAYRSADIFPRSLMTLSGSYNIPNLNVRLRLAYTNNPFGSTARGAGQPQVSFALECAIDMLAEKLGVDPFEFRLQNSLRPGQAKCTGWVVEEWPFPEVMKAIQPQYERALKEAAAYRTGRVRRGVGLGAGAHGVGRTGEGAAVAVELDSDGGISIYAAAADPGEGNDSMLSQITATVMNVPLDKVRLCTRETDVSTATGPAAGSRITYMIGGALISALEQLKAAMQVTGAKNGQDLTAAGKPNRYVGTKKNEDAGPMDPKTGQGPSFVSDIHGVQLVELEVDTETGDVTILKVTAAVDAGTVINPQNLTGQLEGGMDMGVGYALREEYVVGETVDWVTYKFPTIRQSFEMGTILVETPRSKGPLGATGVGEMCLVPTAPAVINAIRNATGVWICDLPATPDKIKAALAALKQ